MNVIVCLDDKNGMMFNKRRVSQDKKVREDMIGNLNGKKLIMNTYSYQMFKEDYDIDNIVVEDILPITWDDYQFIENIDLSAYDEQINQIIIYYWNRVYPSDLRFHINTKDDPWKLILEEDFVGNSHDKITKKIFQKVRG